MPETNARIKVCHDTAANFQTNNPTLLVGEWALETDTKKMKIGDGTTPYNSLQYSTAEESEEWQKPAEWIDIRSGAIDNSIYFLVGHSADFTQYPEFSVYATVTNSGTYDVYVDGVKKATTASETTTTLNWQTLNLVSGWDVTYPQAFRTHIVRITPSVSTNNFDTVHIAGNSTSDQGLLWAHFSIKNDINIKNFLSQGSSYTCRLVEAITAIDDVIKLKYLGISYSFRNAENLQYLAGIDGNNNQQAVTQTFYGCKKLKRIRFKNFSSMAASYDSFYNCNNLKKIETDKIFTNIYGSVFVNCEELEEFPPFKFYIGGESSYIRKCKKLKETFLDLSYLTAFKTILLRGDDENNRQDGLKGVVFNPSVNISGASPQIDIRYTGLDRSALVNLFNSMPYNVGYTVVGSPTITDGVISGFSASNYATISMLAPTSYPQEWYVDFTTGSNLTTEQDLIGTAGPLRVVINVSSQIVAQLTHNGTLTGHYGGKLNANTEYLLKIIATITGTSIFYKKKSDSSWTTIYEGDAVTEFAARTINIGIYSPSYPHPFQGSIDLNNTYININSVPWFRGKAATTRTCSIVGCTGTADLTQDDKNIALNKGWELTVA